jgi:toxin YhaV
MKPPPPRVLGWWLLAWPDFQEMFDRLVEQVEGLRRKDPEGYQRHPKTKLLATLLRVITQDVPRNPMSAEFRQGGTLGTEFTGWFRVKFHQRFRLFFRFDSHRKAIVYAWVNVEGGLRKVGDRNDPYNVFRRMLERGKPPTSFEDLVRESTGLALPP